MQIIRLSLYNALNIPTYNNLWVYTFFISCFQGEGGTSSKMILQLRLYLKNVIEKPVLFNKPLSKHGIQAKRNKTDKNRQVEGWIKDFASFSFLKVGRMLIFRKWSIILIVSKYLDLSYRAFSQDDTKAMFVIPKNEISLSLEMNYFLMQKVSFVWGHQCGRRENVLYVALKKWLSSAKKAEYFPVNNRETQQVLGCVLVMLVMVCFR